MRGDCQEAKYKDKEEAKKMNTLKNDFVVTKLAELLKSFDSTVHSCTYTYENENEIVTVWFDDGYFGEKVCVTGDSLAQLTLDVIKKVIME